MSYRGGKARHAAQIAQVLRGVGVVSTPPLLIEPGPWAEFWGADRQEVAAVLQGWVQEPLQALWERLAAAPVPSDPIDRVAAWLVLQRGSYGGRPVYAEGGRWITAGHLGAALDRAAQRERALAAGNTDAHRWAVTTPGVAELIATLQALPTLPSVQADLRDVTPVAGAVLFLDPPYQGTSCGYGHDLPRADVLAIVDRWRGAGCRVVISEAEPLPVRGAQHLQLSGPRGGGRTSSRQQAEWLTVV